MAADSDDYDVVLLIEAALSAGDAARVRSLHTELDQPVKYHVLLPMDDAAAQVEASLGTMGGGEMLGNPGLGAPGIALDEDTIDAVREQGQERADGALAASLASLAQAGAEAVGQIVTEPPVDALGAKVQEVDGREAIVLTRPHVVAEFFHLDWSAQAKRKLGVPVLHLLERENFDEQAGEGEGITGV